VLLIAVVVVAVLMSALWKPGALFTLLGIAFEGQDMARNAIMILVVIASLLLTRTHDRRDNGFHGHRWRK